MPNQLSAQERQEILRDLAEQQIKGQLSKELLQCLEGLLEECKRQIYNSWRQCSKVEEWAELKAELKALERFEYALISSINSGLVAQEYTKELEQQEE